MRLADDGRSAVRWARLPEKGSPVITHYGWWNEFTDNQRLYDGYHNQWDLCSALAPDEVPEDDDSGYGGTSTPLPDAEFPDLPGVPDALEPAQEPGDADTAADLMDSYDLQGL
ncbi:hypothetical protein B0H11DRAFT_2235262 [Mycena galericulata]|nr:hypothetical protein B0H11DRAFT_2235262 [Mycena galericulata]